MLRWKLLSECTFFRRYLQQKRISFKKSFLVQVSFNPENHTEICVSGKGVFKLLHYFEGSLKQSSSPKLELHNFLAHGWMSKTRVIAGTDTGSLMVFDSGDLRREFSVKASFPKQDAERCGVDSLIGVVLGSSGCLNTRRVFLPFSSVNGRKQKDSTLIEADRDARITSIVVYSRGFACSAGKGAVCLFEKTEEKDYIKTREILVTPLCQLQRTLFPRVLHYLRYHNDLPISFGMIAWGKKTTRVIIVL